MSRVCPTCPYKWVIAQRISMRTHLKRKEVDDVLGGKDSWANVDVVDGESMSMASARGMSLPFHLKNGWNGEA
jgi:hypothetical protein